MSAVGIAKGYINGSAFDSDLLSPGWVNFNKRIPFYEFNVTDKALNGENIFSFIVGNGWGVGRIAWFGKENYSDRPLFWCEIDIEYSDGKKECFGSDESFELGFGQIAENDIFDGENQDGRIEVEYNLIAKVFSGYKNKLKRAIVPLTTEHEILKGYLLSLTNGYLIYDFHQNHAGNIGIEILDAEEGTKLTCIFGEILNADGSLYVDNLRTAKCTDTYICRKGKQIFQPNFTYHGYRYAGIKIEGKCNFYNVYSRVIYSDIEFNGEFACSDKNVTKLYENIKWGQKSNFVNIPTDCPQRDERLGWSGDCQIFCKTAMYNADCKEFFKKYLCDLRDAQTNDGMIDCVAPTVKSDFDNVLGSPAWGDIITVLPYEYYLVYKDKSVLKENLDAAKRWVDYCVRSSENYIRPPRGYGDWLNVDDVTDKSVIGTLYMAYSALLVSRMCAITDLNGQNEYFQLYNKIKAAFIEKFVSNDGKIESDTQTAYLLAYSFGILSADKIKPHLLRTIERTNRHLSTGFVGVKFLLPVLSKLGESDLAYELLTKTDYPSWCYSVVNGATTVWERWNSYSLENGFADIRMNSFNHYSLGSVGEWLYSDILGIRFTETGTVIKPIFDKSGKITKASGGCMTVDGPVKIEWRYTNEKVELFVDKPKNCILVLDDYNIIEKDGNRFLLCFIDK